MFLRDTLYTLFYLVMIYLNYVVNWLLCLSGEMNELIMRLIIIFIMNESDSAATCLCKSVWKA